MIRSPVLGFLGLLLVTAPGAAFAHAALEHAMPPVGGTVATSPSEIDLMFSEELEPRFSSIQVTDAAGKRMDKGDVHAAPGDAKRLVVDVNSLPPGTYVVTWRAVSVDTHRTEGRFDFTVGR